MKEEDDLLDGLMDSKDESTEGEYALEIKLESEELSEVLEEGVFLVAVAVKGSDEVVDDDYLTYSHSQTSNQ